MLGNFIFNKYFKKILTQNLQKNLVCSISISTCPVRNRDRNNKKHKYENTFNQH